MERTESDRITKRAYVGKCAGNRSVGQTRKGLIDIVKDYLKNKLWMSGKQEEW